MFYGKFDTSEDVATATYKGYVAFSITNTAFIDRMSNYCELRDNGSVIAKSVAATIAHDYPQLKFTMILWVVQRLRL